jgi:hypothetical protein
VRSAARYAAEVKTLEFKGSQSTIRYLLSFSILQSAGPRTAPGTKRF